MGLHTIDNLTVFLILSFWLVVMSRNAPHFPFMFIIRWRFNLRNLIHYKGYFKISD